jgi:hypothetical protein
MPDQDMFEILLLIDFIVDVEHRTTRVPKDVLDAFVPQAADDDLSTGQFHVSHGENFLIFRKG